MEKIIDLKIHNYLKTSLYLTNFDLCDISYPLNSEKVLYKLTDDQMEQVRDWASERLQKIGFNQDYELTKEGEILEEIIDLFY